MSVGQTLVEICDETHGIFEVFTGSFLYSPASISFYFAPMKSFIEMLILQYILSFLIRYNTFCLFVCLFERAPEVTNDFVTPRNERPWCGI